jgi:hypothetical protein
MKREGSVEPTVEGWVHWKFTQAWTLAAMLVGSSFEAVIALFLSSRAPTLPGGKLKAA